MNNTNQNEELEIKLETSGMDPLDLAMKYWKEPEVINSTFSKKLQSLRNELMRKLD